MANDLHLDRVMQAIRKRGPVALARAGAYMRGIARRKIRTVKNKQKHSAPGEPPRAHDNRYKNAIAFAVNAEALTVSVGPVLYPDSKGNPGGRTVPQTLEHGGPVKPPRPAPWWRKHPALATADAAGWLAYYQSRKAQGRDFGPAYAGATEEAALAARARASKAMAKGARHMSRGRARQLIAVNAKTGEKYKAFFAFIKVATIGQARRVMQTARRWFGPPGGQTSAAQVAPRPLMAPTLAAAKEQFPRIFAGLVSQ
ncbi:MAG: hypothetical protein J6P03_03440 [Opitutales bacterium]|nr:hypothetical protein [Opitutales bacterium]